MMIMTISLRLHHDLGQIEIEIGKLLMTVIKHQITPIHHDATEGTEGEDHETEPTQATQTT